MKKESRQRPSGALRNVQALNPVKGAGLKATAMAADHERENPTFSGLRLLVDLLKHKRHRAKIQITTLAKRAGVEVTAIERLEAHDLNSVGLKDLLSIASALGSKLTVQLAPIRPKLPDTNAHILRDFDSLVRGRGCNPFVRSQPDTEYPEVLWDIVGDTKRNWLFVIASHRTIKRLRFGAVTDEPGGWAIAGQTWGIDAETDAIARKMADRLFKQHRNKLAAHASHMG